jgi:hypothetical protein
VDNRSHICINSTLLVSKCECIKESKTYLQEEGGVVNWVSREVTSILGKIKVDCADHNRRTQQRSDWEDIQLED